jgi:hypothetical protein
MQSNNAQIMIWSSLLHRDIQEDSNKIYLVFSKLYFICYEFYKFILFSGDLIE